MQTFLHLPEKTSKTAAQKTVEEPTPPPKPEPKPVEPPVEDTQEAVAAAPTEDTESTEAVPPVPVPVPPTPVTPPAPVTPPPTPPPATPPPATPPPAAPPPPISVTPPQPSNPEASAETSSASTQSNSGQSLEWGAAEPEVPSSSRVSINVNVPGAVVYVNDVRKGNAPINVTLPMGEEAVIKAEMDGYTPQTKRLVPGQEEQSVNLTLEAVVVEAAALQQVIFIKPIGLTISIDGKTISIPQMTQLPIGLHTATWTDANGVSQQKSVPVAQSSTPVRISLE